MRIAQPVGLSQDGRSLLVATPSGEQLAIPVDDRLHAALRGDRPRLGQLEIEMDNALGPRDIQARIRAGQSLEEVGRVAGLPLDRVERFAAPVLAEREHVALVALSSSIRRRGETSGHRVLRLAVNERLQQRGVDVAAVDWDAFRQSNGRWSVTARYQSGEAQRQAVFQFDLQGRFSMAENDEARWLVGEQSSLKGPQPGRRRPTPAEADDADTEPTLNLNDELALVRVVQPSEPDLATPAPGAPADNLQVEAQPDDEERENTGAASNLRELHPVAAAPPARADQEDRAGNAPQAEADHANRDDDQLSDSGTGSPLDTLVSVLGSSEDGAPAAYGGLSDASAVPETDLAGWEPGLVVDYPVEPSPEPADDADSAPSDPDATPELSAPASTPASPKQPTPEQPAERPAAKRKRAAVPSWDEIMFGGPPRSG